MVASARDYGEVLSIDSLLLVRRLSLGGELKGKPAKYICQGKDSMDFASADALNSAIRTIGIRHRALAASLLAPLGLHPGQEVLLLDLARHGARTQSQLAGACGCEPPTITVSVRRLEAQGVVVRRPSPHDARATIVELSEHGQQLIAQLKAAWQRLAELTVAGLNEYTDLDVAVGVLCNLADSLSARDRAS